MKISYHISDSSQQINTDILSALPLHVVFACQGPEGIKIMFKSAEPEFFPAHKC